MQGRPDSMELSTESLSYVVFGSFHQCPIQDDSLSRMELLTGLRRHLKATLISEYSPYVAFESFPRCPLQYNSCRGWKFF